MSLGRFLSHAIFPSFEKDLGRSLLSQLEACTHMVDNFMAPQAFAYGSSRGGSGAFRQGVKVESRKAADSVKVYYPVQQRGLFQDTQESFHHIAK